MISSAAAGLKAWSKMSENIGYKKGKDAKFWKQYTHARPLVPDSFFEAIFKYHAEHNGGWDLLHEPGAGAGIHTSRLAWRFKRAVISDFSQQNIDIASEQNQLQQCEFRALNIEDPLPEDGVVDMVVCLNMLHFSDLPKALTAIRRQLKPGGTFVYGFFAWPAFPDNKEAQDLLEQMCRRGLGWLKNVQGRDLSNVALFVSNGDHVTSDGFVNVRRQRTNFPEGFSWRKQLVPEGLEFDPWPVANPKEVELLQDDGWSFKMGVEDLKEHLASHPWGEVPGLLDDLWPPMADAMGRRKISAVWPVTCALATKQ